MEGKPIKTNEGDTPRTLEVVEAEILAIDEEIVREGDGVNQNRLKELLLRKTALAKESAILKGEPLDERLPYITPEERTNLRK